MLHTLKTIEQDCTGQHSGEHWFADLLLIRREIFGIPLELRRHLWVAFLFLTNNLRFTPSLAR
jgi:hypothetical protein